jgi:ubiquinone/menaquinone biosynthesis C-methylase UbiE
MITASPSAAIAFWDRIALRYARDPIRNVPAYEATLADILSRLGASDRVLEVGCGTGTTALRLAPHVGQLTATDASGAMIAIARAKAADAGLQNLTFDVAPAEASGPPAMFDAVLALNLLHLVEDLPATLTALRARLRPGGLFISKSACIGEMAAPIRWALPVMRMLGKAPPVQVFRTAQLESAVACAGLVVEASRTSPRAPHARYIVARRPATDDS